MLSLNKIALNLMTEDKKKRQTIKRIKTIQILSIIPFKNGSLFLHKLGLRGTQKMLTIGLKRQDKKTRRKSFRPTHLVYACFWSIIMSPLYELTP